MVKNQPDNAEDTGSSPGSGRSPGEGNGNPLQCSCLGNPMDRGAWWDTGHGVAKGLDMTELLNNNYGISKVRESSFLNDKQDLVLIDWA